MNVMNYLRDRLKKDKVTAILFSLYVVFAVFSTIYFFIISQLRNAIIAILILLLVPAYFIIEYYLKVEFGYGFLVAVLIICIGGAQLGPCYDFYIKYPLFDDFLHMLSGYLFCCLGFMISKRIIRDNRIHVHIFIGVLFSLTIALLWEMVEFGGTTIFGIDMQEDSIIHTIRSFYLANSHNDIVVIDEIFETIIKYGEDKEIVINGYLDLGVFDTLTDMFVCLIGTLICLINLIFDNNNKVKKIICSKTYADANIKI